MLCGASLRSCRCVVEREIGVVECPVVSAGQVLQPFFALVVQANQLKAEVGVSLLHGLNVVACRVECLFVSLERLLHRNSRVVRRWVVQITGPPIAQED